MIKQFLSLTAIVLATGISTLANSMEYDTDSIRKLPPLEEVVVTGTNTATGRNLIPYTVSVIDRRAIESDAQPQLLTTLSGMVPSLFVTQRSIFGYGVSSNGGAGHIKMRGVGGDRASGILMMVDGQPQFAGIYSHHVGDFYTKNNVAKVEVLRGPGSVLYGSNAMAGVINITTAEPHKKGVKTTLSSQYGSYNTWLSTLTNTTRFGLWSTLFSLSYDRTDGTQKNFDFSQWSGYAKIGYEFSPHWKGITDYTLIKFKGNDPIYPRLSNPASTDIYRQDVVRGETSIAISNKYDRTNGAARIYYSYGNHVIDDPRHFRSVDDRFGVLLYQNLHPWTLTDITVGFDFNSYSGKIPMSGGKNHTAGSLSTMERKRITEYSPYFTIAQGLIDNSLIVNGGLRMANSDMFGSQWIPQAGIVYNNSRHGITAKASIAMGYRNPSFRELYLYKMANPELNPEKMLNYEVSVSKSLSRYLNIEVTAYLAKGANMIQVENQHNVNTGRFINKGIEISANSHPIDNLWINASYSYLHTSLSNLTGAPKNQYYIGINYRPVKAIDICADIKGIGSLYVAPEIENQSYVLLNAKIGYDILRFLNLFISAENITDRHYVINRGYDMPGITMCGGFKLTF
ncbi:MAG: TonB-dependent receptor [Paramuribaculum sp.]|nr:TonB-dependent receptor [Paramuribaculum sp.]